MLTCWMHEESISSLTCLSFQNWPQTISIHISESVKRDFQCGPREQGAENQWKWQGTWLSSQRRILCNNSKSCSNVDLGVTLWGSETPVTFSLGETLRMDPTHWVHCKFKRQTGVDPDYTSIMKALRVYDLMSCRKITDFAKSVQHWMQKKKKKPIVSF